MHEPLFNRFRLVGGTALSLQLGNRISIDIDLFTDATYGSVNFKEIDSFLTNHFDFIFGVSNMPVAMGKSYRVGKDESTLVKLDFYYTDNFIFEPLIVDGIRMATIAEILAMKVDVIQRGGRKKDFWDIHELMESFSLQQMLALHQKRYPYNHDPLLIKRNMIDFGPADHEPDPICMRGKHWELIKYDLITLLEN
ncbi:nucleotidyl transferase AbiEii/AbiGii toxin family protein [Pedobacter sp. Leaf216]|uniref:nucleotidyl transferase AbiEii/AbiGii toxin family protein n=1 Tax=Pedobacter sp. Leaf216 TaxID=1735684 RepID=UPI001F35727C|nr:nucleotidyl transferase AbiEii/AbiGii toxin family protein [Pedobacter sp. Leaf216]